LLDEEVEVGVEFEKDGEGKVNGVDGGELYVGILYV
jgi:hypothetical protein